MMNFHQNSQWSYELNIDAFMNDQNPNPMNGHGIEHWIHEFVKVPTPHSPTKTPNSHLCHIVEVYSCPREGNCFEEGK
jgi:hypothetical protein